MEESDIVFVFFDGGGVLFNGIPGPMLLKLAESYGADDNLEDFQRQQIRERVATANQLAEVREAWRQLKTNAAFTEYMYWEVLIRAAALRENIEQCQQLVRDSMLVHPEALQIAHMVSTSMTESGERRHIGILSNHSVDWFTSYVQKGDVHRVFNETPLVVVSQEVGCAKPDFMIFQAAMERIFSVRPNTKPSEVLFFDDKESNIEAARQFGWKAELFNNATQGADVLRQHLANYNILF